MIGQSYTWGSNLSYHPHVHCIVPGGGITINGKWRRAKSKGKWRRAKSKGKYLFPVKAMSAVFRGKYIQYLKEFMDFAGMSLDSIEDQLYAHKWTVYAKSAPRSNQNLIHYLARYTHQIAISPQRIISHDKKSVRFQYTDYRHKNQKKVMTLPAWEFVRRFAQHILPHGFTRIRHYGILSSQWKKDVHPNVTPPKESWIQFWANRDLEVELCPHCRKGKLILIGNSQTTRTTCALPLKKSSPLSSLWIPCENIGQITFALGYTLVPNYVMFSRLTY